VKSLPEKQSWVHELYNTFVTYQFYLISFTTSSQFNAPVTLNVVQSVESYKKYIKVSLCTKHNYLHI
jgi:hypothetical protein